MDDNVLEIPKFGHIEVWVNEEDFKEKVLDKIGEADYETIERAIDNGETVTYRYIVENYSRKGESILFSAQRIKYSQMFINGVSVGYYEDHPNIDLNAEPRPKTIYYDLVLKTIDGKYCVKRIGSMYVWIKQ